MPNYSKRGDRIPSGTSKQEMTSRAKGGVRRSAHVVPLMATLLCALAVIVSGCGGGGGSSTPNQAVQPQPTATDTAAQEKQAADEAAKVEAEHKKLKEEAAAAGEQVFEGTIILGSGVEVAERFGTTAMLDGNGPKYREMEEKSKYALLALDSPQPVYITGFNGDPFIREFSYIVLGGNSYNPYNNSYQDSGYSNWEPYGNKRVCVAVNKCGVNEGASIMNQTGAQESRLLYEIDGGTTTTAAQQPAQQTAQQPAQQTAQQPAQQTAQPSTSAKDKAIAEARSSGNPVASGTVQVLGLLDYCGLVGYSTSSPNVQYYGNSLRAAVLTLDDASKAELGYDHLVLGSEVGIGGPVDPWSQYDGKQVVVRGTSIGRSGGEISDTAMSNPEVVYEG